MLLCSPLIRDAIAHAPLGRVVGSAGDRYEHERQAARAPFTFAALEQLCMLFAGGLLAPDRF